jgi:predicted chitinase
MSLIKLQEKIGVKPDGSFGPATLKAAMAYYKLSPEAAAHFFGKPVIMDNPDLVATDYAFEAALFFFDKNKLWDIANKGVTTDTILAMTLKINGGKNGLEDRLSLTQRYYTWLKN